MVAVVPMFDPPRHDTKETIERCIEKGIMVKMVTGDQLLIGKETAKQLGMGQNFYTTEELMEVRHIAVIWLYRASCQVCAARFHVCTNRGQHVLLCKQLGMGQKSNM